MPEPLTVTTFDASSPDPWTVHLAEDLSVALRVIETNVQAEPRPFSVRFAGPLSPELPQATFDVSHPSLGHTALFLVPIARTSEEMHYEAVFG